MLGVEETIIDPVHNEQLIGVFGQEKLRELSAAFRSLPPENPVTQFNFHEVDTNDESSAKLFRITDANETNIQTPGNAKYTTYKLVCRATFTLAEPQRYTGVIGKLVPLESEYCIMKGANIVDVKGML